MAVAVTVAALAAACAVPFDYDNDGKADVAWMAADGRWFRDGAANPIFEPGLDPSRTPPAVGTPVPGDYDGNRVWEPAVVFSDGTWITGGGRGTFSFPPPPNPYPTLAQSVPPPQVLPVPADYDGDGKTDAAWYRESDATWWIQGQPSPIQFGVPWQNTIGDTGFDVPVPADYDGDHRADIAVYSPRNATFTIRGQAGPIPVGYPYGTPAVADYDGDGRADPAVFNKISSAPDARPYGPPAFHFADGSSLAGPTPGAIDDAVWTMSANYDGTPGDEAAMAYWGQPSIWVSGRGAVIIPTGATPIANPANLTTLLRTELGFRCWYDVDDTYFADGCN